MLSKNSFPEGSRWERMVPEDVFNMIQDENLIEKYKMEVKRDMDAKSREVADRKMFNEQAFRGDESL